MDYEQITVETPEHVNISYELAGPGSRLIAALVDHLLISLMVLTLVIVAAAVQVQVPSFRTPLMVIMFVGGGPLLLLVLYFTLFEVLWSGQTPGKRVGGLRVMHDDGTPATTLDFLIRNTVRVVDFLPYFYFIGGLIAFVHKQSKRLGDVAAGTVVVKLRGTPLPEAIEPPQPSLTAANDLVSLVRPAVATLSPSQRATIDRFLQRRSELNTQVRSNVAGRIVETLSHSLPPEAAALGRDNPEALLEALAQVCSKHRAPF